MFGHMADSHTVCNRCSSIVARSRPYVGPAGNFTRSQLGFRPGWACSGRSDKTFRGMLLM
jgi:hypothetical protein